jgi:hypothetical protein
MAVHSYAYDVLGIALLAIELYLCGDFLPALVQPGRRRITWAVLMQTLRMNGRPIREPTSRMRAISI